MSIKAYQRLVNVSTVGNTPKTVSDDCKVMMVDLLS